MPKCEGAEMRHRRNVTLLPEFWTEFHARAFFPQVWLSFSFVGVTSGTKGGRAAVNPICFPIDCIHGSKSLRTFLSLSSEDSFASPTHAEVLFSIDLSRIPYWVFDRLPTMLATSLLRIASEQFNQGTVFFFGRRTCHFWLSSFPANCTRFLSSTSLDFLEQQPKVVLALCGVGNAES
jgi:hypothetical protein